MDEQSERGFRVTDRRRFTEEGAAPDTPEAPADDASRAAAQAAFVMSESPSASDASPVTFTTFVLGFSTQALMHLGEIPDPVTHQASVDLPAAKQVIDILGILAAKTTNNLEREEKGLLDTVLYDLRMRYVQAVRSSAPKEGS